MTLMSRALLYCFLTLLALSTQAQTQRPELDNNTSGCDYDSNFDVGGPCEGQFVGMFDNNASGPNRGQGDGEYNAHVTSHDQLTSHIGGMVSTIDVHQLLYANNKTMIFAGYQPWFKLCHYDGPFQTVYPVPPDTTTFPAGGYGVCNSHVETGYDANSEAFFAELEDFSQRGFNGYIIDWYGQGHVHEDTVTKDLTQFSTHIYCTGIQECSLYYVLMEDEGSWDGACPQDATTDQTSCIISSLDTDFDYMNETYFSFTTVSQDNNPTAGYLKISPTGPTSDPWQVSATGGPVVLLFIAQSLWKYPAGTLNAQGQDIGGQPNADWTTIWDTVRSHLASFGANEPYLIFENGNAFSHTLFPQSDGGFAWFAHFNDPTNCTFTSTGDPEDLCLLYHFYKSASTATESWNPAVPMIQFGAAWKGFDNTYAGWREFTAANANVASIMPQRCGRTWLDSFARANAVFGSAKELPFLQVATWNDYDEGHEIETGIENCWSVNASLPAGSSVVTWTLDVAPVQINAAANATQDTVDHFEIWVAGILEASLPASARSFDLAGLNLASGTYSVLVLEISKPSIRNQISTDLSYTKP